MSATYTPDKDVVEPFIDGSGVRVVARAGAPIAWATAVELGLVTGDPPAEPKTKKPAPSKE